MFGSVVGRCGAAALPSKLHHIEFQVPSLISCSPIDMTITTQATTNQEFEPLECYSGSTTASTSTSTKSQFNNNNNNNNTSKPQQASRSSTMHGNRSHHSSNRKDTRGTSYEGEEEGEAESRGRASFLSERDELYESQREFNTR